MVEYLQISCPKCQRTLRVRKQYAGLEVACSHCGSSFVVQQPDESPESTTQPERPPAQAAWESERESFRQQIAALTNELEQLRQESAALRTERDRLSLEASQAHDRAAELAEEVRSLESKLAQSTIPAEVPADQPSAEELRGQVRKLQIQNDELRSVIHGLGITVG